MYFKSFDKRREVCAKAIIELQTTKLDLPNSYRLVAHLANRPRVILLK
jgi:hypothetical protein